MKYLTCTITDETYSNLHPEVFDTIEEARNEFAMWYTDIECVYEWKYENMRIDINYGNLEFIVGEIFGIPDNAKYVVVWHHAYDGVGIVVEMTTEVVDEAKQYLRDRKREMKNHEQLLSHETDFQICYDTGEEWELWTIIRV